MFEAGYTLIMKCCKTTAKWKSEKCIENVRRISPSIFSAFHISCHFARGDGFWMKCQRLLIESCVEVNIDMLSTHLSWNAMKQTESMKKRKVCRVCLVHFTEHLSRISYFTSFCSRWWFLNEMSKVSDRVLCKSALIHTLESKFHENDKKCVFAFFFVKHLEIVYEVGNTISV